MLKSIRLKKAILLLMYTSLGSSLLRKEGGCERVIVTLPYVNNEELEAK